MPSTTRRMCDTIIALVMMVFFGIAIVLFGIPLYRENRSVLFWQERAVSVSPSGECEYITATILKLSSMPYGTGGPRWKDRVKDARSDPRIGPWSRFVRETHLDELGQWHALLMGHVTFIGPRAVTPELAEYYKKEVPNYKERWQLLSGVIGYAQLFGPECTLQEGPATQLALDKYYIEHRSLMLDVKIIAQTTWVVMRSFTGCRTWQPRLPADLYYQNQGLRQQEAA